MKIGHVCVVGLGYIGLPTASILASQGLKVTGVDINPEIVNTINEGRSHFVEKDLDVLVQTVVHSKNLSASLVVVEADAFIIAVPTPFKGDHQPDLSFVKQAVLTIAPLLRAGNLVIVESTSPVGTTALVAEWVYTIRPDLKTPALIHFAYCPERVLPGNILQELIANNRIIGGIDDASALQAKKLYETFVRGQIMITDARTAEMVKLTENAFRDVNIAFANELANICDHLNMNVWELIKLANYHPRVNILQPGPGVGGHCIAVDPWFIVDSAPKETKLIRAAREVNDDRPNKILAKIHQALAECPNATIACLGLAFKANVDDLRESPAVEIVEKLAAVVTNDIYVAEPHVQRLPHSLRQYAHVQLMNAEKACNDAKIIVFLVNHEIFYFIEWKHSLKGKILIDTQGIIRTLS